MQIQNFKNKKPGFTLVEVIVAGAIIATSITAIIGAYTLFLKYSFQNTPSIQATLLAEEGIEALKTMRDSGWNANIKNLTLSTSYYLSFNTSTNLWSSTTTSSVIDSQFIRTFTLSSVNRDTNSNIATAGTLDANTKLVSVSVSFKGTSGTSTKSLSTYITNLYNN